MLAERAPHPGVHRRTGGLEINQCAGHVCLCVHRRTGGLEIEPAQGGFLVQVHRRTGGLESKVVKTMNRS